MSNPPPLPGKPKLTMRSRLVLAGVIVIIYAAACCSPALHFDNYYPGQSAPQSSDTWFGWTALLLGWLGFFVGSVAWLANLSLAVAVFFLLLGLRWPTLICSALAILLSLDLFPVFSAKIPADEGGVGQAVLQPPYFGVWLWFASLGAAFIVALILFLVPKKKVC